MERNLIVSEIIVQRDEIHFTIRQSLSAVSSSDNFQLLMDSVERQAKQLLRVLEPFFVQHEGNTCQPVLNAHADKLVFRCNGMVRYVLDPFGENSSGNFTGPGTWKRLRNAIIGFDSKIQVFKGE